MKSSRTSVPTLATVATLAVDLVIRGVNVDAVVVPGYVLYAGN